MVTPIDIFSYDTFGKVDIVGADYCTSTMQNFGRGKAYQQHHIDFKDDMDYNNAIIYLMDRRDADFEGGLTLYVER